MFPVPSLVPGVVLKATSALPSPSTSPTLQSFGEYVYATPSEVVPPAGCCKLNS